MKKPTLILSLAIAGALVLTPIAPATAATAATGGPMISKVITYKNCTALNKVYRGGVAKAGVKFNTVSGKKKAFKVAPKSSTALYNANKKLDRDRDGIACEK